MKRIHTLTLNPTIDTSTSVGSVVPDNKLRCSSPRHEAGGGGINVSRVLTRLDTGSRAIYTAGGENGKRLTRLLREEGIEIVPVSISGMTRENFMVYEESSGQQFRFGMPGPEMVQEESEHLLKELPSLMSEANYLVASGSLPPGVPESYYAEVASIASNSGVRFVVDTSGAALRAAVKAGVYLLKPNMRELQELTGQIIENESQQLNAAEKILSEGKCEILVLSLGAQGVLLFTEGHKERLRAPSVPVKSRVGAGDSMVAGMVKMLSEGSSVKEAVLFGIAAGSAATMTPGTELCRKEDVCRLYDQLLSGET
jgi:6-phosphofructokinase 2